jgi:SAM-dependent MidA family methyltransferase
MRDDSKIGTEGDFYTSSDVTPLFGYTLAGQLAQMWALLDSPPQWQVVEYGAGKGRLAGDILVRLRDHHTDAYEGLQYYIIEISPAMRELQKKELSGEPGAAGKVVWVSHPEEINFPGGITGCIFSNELIDAFPVHIIRKTGEELKELYIKCVAGGLEEAEGPLSNRELEKYIDLFDIRLEEGQRAEINLAAERWLREAAAKIYRGFLLTIDYGGKAEDIYTPMRPQGTLRCYSRHRLVESPLERPGCCDITANVNFSALMKWGEELGLQQAGYTTQMNFLINLGIIEMIGGQNNFSFDMKVLKNTMAVKKLIMPEGMGNIFKVLAQYKGFSERPRLRGF